MKSRINHSAGTDKMRDYRTLFDKAQDNLALVCEEYWNITICQKHNPRQRISILKSKLI